MTCLLLLLLGLTVGHVVGYLIGLHRGRLESLSVIERVRVEARLDGRDDALAEEQLRQAARAQQRAQRRGELTSPADPIEAPRFSDLQAEGWMAAEVLADLRANPALYQQAADTYSADIIAERGRKIRGTISLAGVVWVCIGRTYQGGAWVEVDLRRLYPEGSEIPAVGGTSYAGMTVSCRSSTYVFGPEKVTIKLRPAEPLKAQEPKSTSPFAPDLSQDERRRRQNAELLRQEIAAIARREEDPARLEALFTLLSAARQCSTRQVLDLVDHLQKQGAA